MKAHCCSSLTYSAQPNERQLKHHMFLIKNCIKLHDNNGQSRGKSMEMRAGLLVKINPYPAHVIQTCSNLPQMFSHSAKLDEVFFTEQLLCISDK